MGIMMIHLWMAWGFPITPGDSPSPEVSEHWLRHGVLQFLGGWDLGRVGCPSDLVELFMHSLAVVDAWIVWVVMTFSYRLILRSATSTHCIEIQTWIILNHWISDWQPDQDQTRIVYLVSCVLLLPCLLFCIVCTHIGHPNIVVGLSWSVIVAFHIAAIIGCIPIMIGWCILSRHDHRVLQKDSKQETVCQATLKSRPKNMIFLTADFAGEIHA